MFLRRLCVRETATTDVRAYVRCDIYNSRDSLFFSVELPALMERPDVASITIYSNCGGGMNWVIVEQPKPWDRAAPVNAFRNAALIHPKSCPSPNRPQILPQDQIETCTGS